MSEEFILKACKSFQRNIDMIKFEKKEKKKKGGNSHTESINRFVSLLILLFIF